MSRRSIPRPVLAIVALAAGLFTVCLPSGVAAIPACPPGATVITGGGAGVTANGIEVKCLTETSFISNDIQAYQDAVIFASGHVGEDIEGYGNATVHVLGGTVDGNVDAYTRSTINVYGGDILGHVSAYSNSTVNVFGGDIGLSLIMYSSGTINLVAASLSNYGFGEVLDTTGTIEGTFADGSAFALDFNRTRPETTLLLVAVPEPGTFALVGSALAGIGLVRRRRP